MSAQKKTTKICQSTYLHPSVPKKAPPPRSLRYPRNNLTANEPSPKQLKRVFERQYRSTVRESVHLDDSIFSLKLRRTLSRSLFQCLANRSESTKSGAAKPPSQRKILRANNKDPKYTCNWTKKITISGNSILQGRPSDCKINSTKRNSESIPQKRDASKDRKASSGLKNSGVSI